MFINIQLLLDLHVAARLILCKLYCPWLSLKWQEIIGYSFQIFKNKKNIFIYIFEYFETTFPPNRFLFNMFNI